MKVHGPYLDKRGKKHRRIVLLTYDDGSKRTQPYARYLLENYLGRSLEDESLQAAIDRLPLPEQEVRKIDASWRRLRRQVQDPGHTVG